MNPVLLTDPCAEPEKLGLSPDRDSPTLQSGSDHPLAAPCCRSFAQRAFWALPIFLRAAAESFRVPLEFLLRTAPRELVPTNFSKTAIASSSRASSFSARLRSLWSCLSI